MNLQEYRFIDLSLPYDDAMPGYSFESASTVAKDGWNSRNLHFYSHAGTHMDAPHHFEAGPGTIDQYTPEQLIGRAHIADIPVSGSQRLLKPSDLGALEHDFPAGESLLLRTGWSRHLNLASYRNELPRVSKSLARWCAEKRVKMLGVEPPSVADVNNLEEVTEIHLLLLRGGVIIIEGLTNLEQIRKETVLLLAFPLKLTGGDGSPARVIALESRD